MSSKIRALDHEKSLTNLVFHRKNKKKISFCIRLSTRFVLLKSYTRTAKKPSSSACLQKITASNDGLPQTGCVTPAQNVALNSHLSASTA